MHSYAQVALSSLKEALFFNLGAVIVALVVLLLFQVPVSNSFGFILLLESTGLMLIGGALGVAGQGTSRKLAELLTKRKLDAESASTTDLKAALYALTGMFLFVEGAVMAAVLA